MVCIPLCRYQEPLLRSERILSLKLKDGNHVAFDMDQLEFTTTNELLTVQSINDIGIIRINNAHYLTL